MQKQTIRKLQDSEGCACPECEESVYKNVMLPVGKINETGLIEFPFGKKNTANCNLCKYHYCFAEQNIINLIDQNGMIILTAPWPIIDIVEGILASKEMFKKLKNGKKNKKTS